MFPYVNIFYEFCKISWVMDEHSEIEFLICNINIRLMRAVPFAGDDS